MIVYVVTAGCYSDYGIEAIFSTRELAEDYIVANPKKYSGYNDIAEWTVDERAGWVPRKGWYLHLGLSDGSVGNKGSETSTADPNARNEEPYFMPDYVRVTSYVSAEHALKLAVEARQAWLREKGITA